jgi:hypothetical protein
MPEFTDFLKDSDYSKKDLMENFGVNIGCVIVNLPYYCHGIKMKP